MNIKKKFKALPIVKWDGKNIKLTKGYVDAVKNLMREEIFMMRKHHKTTADSWVIGVAEIEDLSSVGGLKMMFGAKEDKEWLSNDAIIITEVPYP